MPTEFDKWRDQKIIEIADEVAEIREKSMDIRQIVEDTLVAPMREQAEMLHFEDNVKAIDAELTRLRAVNAELLSCLKAIYHEYDQSYDASIEPGDSHWTAAASIPVEVMQHAERLIKKHG